MTEAIAKVTACVGRKTKFASDLLVFPRTKLMQPPTLTHTTLRGGGDDSDVS